MPRLEITPAGSDTYAELPTVDVCRTCDTNLREGSNVLDRHDPVTDALSRMGYPGGRISASGVDHPGYNELYDTCAVCGKGLDATTD